MRGAICKFSALLVFQVLVQKMDFISLQKQICLIFYQESIYSNKYTVRREFLYTLYFKNPRFLPNQAGTQAILSTHELIIFTKFHIDWVKIVDFVFLLFQLLHRPNCPNFSLDGYGTLKIVQIRKGHVISVPLPYYTIVAFIQL